MSAQPERSDSLATQTNAGSVHYCHTLDQLRGFAFECAGLGAGAVMAEHPDAVMPTEVIEEGIRRILIEWGIAAEPPR